jgi:hypothetical protein
MPPKTKPSPPPRSLTAMLIAPLPSKIDEAIILAARKSCISYSCMTTDLWIVAEERDRGKEILATRICRQ